MSTPTVSIATVGCRLNQVESDLILESFRRAGYDEVPFGRPADVTVVNSCTVTGRSDYRSRQMARRGRRASPRGTVVLAGCYVQNQPHAAAGVEGVDLVVGNTDKLRIPSILEKDAGPGSIHVDRLPRTFDPEPRLSGRMGGRTRAFLKIQDGCDGACAYCAVRLARGPSRSKPPEAVLDDARAALDAGYREIVLTGINLGRYGLDLRARTTLSAVLPRIAELPGLGRVRLSSVEPQEFTADLVDVVTGHPRICSHVHLPLQSGSDDVLRGMGRPYSVAEYAGLVDALRGRDPDCGVGADLIVGFPGETDKDAAATLSLVDRLSLSYLHVFSFSPRPGTPAAGMRPQVTPEEKKDRSRALRGASAALAARFRSRFVGRTVEVLLETRADGEARGLSGSYVPVSVADPDVPLNRVLRVRIDADTPEGLAGAPLRRRGGAAA